MAKIERESINFKLPKSLVTALRAKARKLNTTATDLVIQGLHHVLEREISTEDSIEKRLYKIEERLEHFASRIENRIERDTELQPLSNLEQKLQEVTNRLALLESAIVQLQRGHTQKKRKSTAYPYYQQASVELQPFTQENLARRLATDAVTLSNNRKMMSQSEFLSWCRSRDPGSVGWRYQDSDQLYYPIK